MKVDGTDVTIDFADAGTRKWVGTWNQLVTGKLLSTIPGWTDEWYKTLGDGTIATLVTGAWMPGVLESSVAAGSGHWRVAPIPTYDGTPVTAENGGGLGSAGGPATGSAGDGSAALAEGGADRPEGGDAEAGGTAETGGDAVR
jgi:ABC-type glycerol-3-phosphate transport system substrate-binding protein